MQTYEEILDRMLDRVPDTIDKREGSIIYDALAPVAAELQLAYIELDYIVNEAFVDTASRENLIRRAKERGVSLKSESPAIVKAEFSKEIEIGSRFSLEDLNYIAIEKITGNQYKLKCEQSGTIGNRSSGDLIPIEYIEGLEYARILEILIHGEDEEDTEVFRARYFESFSAQAFGGNIADYKAKVKAINGVGGVKVIPAWNGPGTVKLTILSSADYGKATSELIQTVQEKIDPQQSGNGEGIAPIGHTVTVDTAEEIGVNVSAHFTFDSGVNFEQKQSEIKEAVGAYLKEIRKSWSNHVNSVVRISQIESKVLAIEGIIDITETKINNSLENLILSNYQIPKLGGVEDVG